MCHQPLIDNPDVTSVTIVEISQDVVDLVWEHCAKDDRFTLVLEDFENWEVPDGMEWDVIWADTWLIDNSIDNYDYKTLIRNKYHAHCKDQTTVRVGFWGD